MKFKQIIIGFLFFLNCSNLLFNEDYLIGNWTGSSLILVQKNNQSGSLYQSISDCCDTIIITKDIQFTSNQVIFKSMILQYILGIPDSTRIFNYCKHNDTLKINWTDISNASYEYRMANDSLFIKYIYGENINDQEIITGKYKRK
jgi:hypothetical protein